MRACEAHQLEGDSAGLGFADADVKEDTAALGLCHCEFAMYEFMRSLQQE